uniref:Transmembrane protein 33 n=1 Tax=Equus caballus TaxID=9796 RepID=A0A9L0RVZ7_HORSE
LPGSAITGGRRPSIALLGLVPKLRLRSAFSRNPALLLTVLDSVPDACVSPLWRIRPRTARKGRARWLHEAASFYQRALLANALTSALRLHQRLPHFQLSRAFLAQALLEDSCHYLLYSLIFVNSYPVTMSIFPVLLFSLLHAATYTKKVLDAKGSNSLPLLRSVLDKLSANQQNILKFIACNEIFLMPATVFMLFR